MIDIMKFEAEKFLKKKNIIAILLCIIILTMYVFINFNIETKRIDYELRSCQLTLKSCKEQLKGLNADKKLITSVALDKAIEDAKLEIDLLEAKETAITKKDWKKILETDIEIDKLKIKGIQENRVVSSDDIETIKSRINKNTILLERNVKPIYEETTMTSYNFLRQASTSVLPLLFILLFLMFSSDIISGENEEGTFKFLLLQPISRTKVLIGKIISITLVSIVTLTIIFALFFFIIGFTKGFGDYNYPIQIINYAGSEMQFIDIRNLVLIMIPMQYLVILFIISLGVLMSVLFQNSSSSIGISIILAITLYLFNNQLKFFGRIAHLNPITYINVPDTITGKLTIIMGNANINLSIGVIVLISTALINILISTIIFNKKDIVC